MIACQIIMFGHSLNILSLHRFWLVFIPQCPKCVDLFLSELSSNEHQTLIQSSLGIDEVCYDFSSIMLYLIYPGFSGSQCGSMSDQ